MNEILRDVYTKSDEFKREQRFLSSLARRSFRKKNTFFCDLCNQFLPTEKHCSTVEMSFVFFRNIHDDSFVASQYTRTFGENSALSNRNVSMATSDAKGG